LVAPFLREFIATSKVALSETNDPPNIKKACIFQIRLRMLTKNAMLNKG